MKIAFYKYQGSGNDFIIIPDFEKETGGCDPLVIRRLCHRHFGIGADGLMDVFDIQPNGRFAVRYYNADGYKAEMCGNGARCAARFASNYSSGTSKWRFRVWEDEYAAEVQADRVRVFWQRPPVKKPLPAEINEPGHLKPTAFWNSGVPHLIIPVEKIEAVHVAEEGAFWRNHPFFQPAGTNVNFIESVAPNQIKIRTYERGVEGETLSCGTGALAVAAEILSQNPKIDEVVLMAPGGRLKAGKRKDNGWWLEGPAQMVFEGRVEV